MRLITIPVGECAVTQDAETILGADSVGSCIAVTFYDPVVQLGGLLHLQYPQSTSDRARAGNQPALYADTGIPHLFEAVCKQGAEKERLLVTITGGAELANDPGAPNTGKRNYLAVRKSLWKLGVMLQGENVGGAVLRSVRLEVATGKLWLATPDQAEQ